MKVELVTPNNPKVVFDNYEETYNDGRWHSVILSITTNKIIFNVDARPMKTTRLLKIVTGGTYLIAGGVSAALGYSNTVFPGFVGCMRTIRIDGNNKLPTDWSKDEYCCGDEVVFDACHMTDRCNPNPCQHGSICKQNSMEFFCICKVSIQFSKDNLNCVTFQNNKMLLTSDKSFENESCKMTTFCKMLIANYSEQVNDKFIVQ